MSILEIIQKASQRSKETIRESFGIIEKSRSGIYSDNAENRKLHRVGQKYGSKKQEEQPKQKVKESENNKKEKKFDKKKVEEYAKSASEQSLQMAIKEHKDENVRKIAHKELERRKKEEYPQKENKNDVKKESSDRVDEKKNEKISNAVAIYQSTLFDAINNELRYDKPDKYKEIISDLDKASKDKTEDVLYRGLDANFTKNLVQKYKIKDFNNIEELKNKLVGQVIKDKGFQSTSRDLNVAADFARDKGFGKTTVMKIVGKKQGIEVSNHLNNRKSKQEKEFVMKRGISLNITDVSISKKTGKLIIYIEVK